MDFMSKHKERDIDLPYKRKKLLDKIQNDLLNDENILGVFYGGSLSNETTDYFSDIDLRVVVRSEKINEYILDKNKRANKWGDVLYFENLNPSSIYTVVHYNCFIKVDVFYYSIEEIQPSVWLKNIKIVKDTNEMIQDIFKQSIALTYKPSLDEFEIWRTKFFAYLHETYRRSMRKEVYYALDCVDKLRLLMSTAWYMDSGIQPNTFGDWAKYEGSRSKLENWQKSLLESWECGRNTIEIMNVVKSIVFEFKKVHHSLCNTLEIQEDTEWVDEVISKVL